LHRALYKAKAYGCTALQIFTKNANTWKERTLAQEDIDRFHQVRRATDVIDIVSHTAYLINLATPEKKKYVLSYNALVNELMRSSVLTTSM
jgi:deoxyribonuclease IV